MHTLYKTSEKMQLFQGVSVVIATGEQSQEKQ